MSAGLRVSERRGSPAWVPPPPDPGTLPRPRNWDTEALPVCPRHGDAYAPSFLRPAPWPARLPVCLRYRGRVRTRCAPRAAPQYSDHTHIQLSPRAQNPSRESCGALCTLSPGPRALGDSRAPPIPPYPQKPTGHSPRARATLTLFGAPAGRSVFSLPAGPDANVEKDGSSASLTAMSDSPGGCLWVGWGAKEGRSQGPTLDRHSGVSDQPSPHPSPCVAPTSLM